MRGRVAVAAFALAALMLLPAARAQPQVDAEREKTEAEVRAARRELMRQYAEQIVAEIRMHLRSGIDYPAEALANRWEGTVWLTILYP